MRMRLSPTLNMVSILINIRIILYLFSDKKNIRSVLNKITLILFLTHFFFNPDKLMNFLCLLFIRDKPFVISLL